VIAGSDSGLVRIWNATTGRVETVLEGHSSDVFFVTFSGDSSKVASGANDNTVRVWNVRTRQPVSVFEGHDGHCAAFSNDGDKVAYPVPQGRIRIWDATTGTREVTVKGRLEVVRSLAFSNDGSKLVSGTISGILQIWNALTGDVEARFERIFSWLHSVAFSGDGMKIISGSEDKMVRIWDAKPQKEESNPNFHSFKVPLVAFAMNGSKLVSASNSSSVWRDLCDVRIWNTVTGELETVLKDGQGNVTSVTFIDESRGLEDTVQICEASDPSGRSGIVAPLCIGRKKLPDGTVVRYTVHIHGCTRFTWYLSGCKPGKAELGRISKDWILKWGNIAPCWISPRYREYQAVVVRGSKLCFGYRNGRVVIVDMGSPEIP